jgi:outer membrane autotransporter protein
VAPALTANTTPGTPVQVTLNTGAAGGPFTAAAVVAVAPAGSGAATVAASGSNYVLTFTPALTFSGTAVVRYTLSNAFATSAESTVTVTVLPRPDPSLDAEVRGLVDAQVESTKRFATTQINNFQQRLERLHSGGEGGFDNRLGFAVDRVCIDPLVGYSVDPCNPDNAGFRGGNSLGNNAAGASAAGDAGTGGPVGAWVGGMIRSGSQDGRNGGADIDFETDGLSTGVDYRVNEAFVIGGGLGYGKDENAIGTQGSRVDGDSQAVAVYASYHPGAIFVDTLLGYQTIDYDLRRYVTANGGTVFGQRDGDQWFASVSVGKDVMREGMMFTPYARLDVAQAQLDPFTETGDPIYALTYDAMDVDTTTGNLGLRLDWLREQSWGRFTPQLRMEYQHDFNGRSSAVVRYADLITGPVYGISATEFDNSRFMLGVGALFDLDSGWGWRLEYRGQVGSSGETDNGVGVNVQKQF